MKYRFYLLTLGVFVLDHISKWAIRVHVDQSSVIEILPRYLRLACVKNSGVAFGLFADFESPWKPYILAAMAVIAVIVILIYSSRMPLTRTLLQVALAVTLGGILGNFTDRLIHGFVIDFIEFHVGDVFHWPTFNIADSAITIGIALLMIDTVRNPDVEEETGQQASE